MPPINTKNLGLIKAIHVGVNPPLNTKIIWYYDGVTPYATGPAKIHYYYDVITSQWLPLGGGGGGGTGNFINIPTPQITISALEKEELLWSDMYAHYLPISQTDKPFTDYKPRYYLFMAKSRRRVLKSQLVGPQIKKIRGAGFYHPTHQDGANHSAHPAWYSGTTPIPLDTEFDIPALSNGPYVKTLIPFNPMQFTKYNQAVDLGTDPTDWVYVDPAKFVSPLNDLNRFRIVGKRVATAQRSVLFTLAIGIENPDENSTNPILFGDFSQQFKMTFDTLNNISGSGLKEVLGYNITIQNSNVHRKN